MLYSVLAPLMIPLCSPFPTVMNITFIKSFLLSSQHVPVTFRVHRVCSATSRPVSVSVFWGRPVGSVTAACRATGASPPAELAPATDTPGTAARTPGAASAAGATARGTPVTGELHHYTKCF